MSRYTKSGVLKAKHNPAYKDPKFFGGLCAVCRKRQRRYNHEHYPHMCDRCRESRTFIHELPFTHPEVARGFKEYDLKVHGPTPTNLSVPSGAPPEQLSRSKFERKTMTLQERIAESAARFRRHQKTKT